MVFIKEKALSSSLSDGLKGGVNSFLNKQQHGLEMQFLLSETSCVSLKMKQNDSHISTDIQTDSKDRNKEETACFAPGLMYRLVENKSSLNLGTLMLVLDW